MLKAGAAIAVLTVLVGCAADQTETESAIEQDRASEGADLVAVPVDDLVVDPDLIDRPLDRTEWVLESVFGQPVPSGSQATLTFDPEVERVNGHTSCNSFTGAYELTGTRLLLSGFGLTRMACPAGFDQVEVDLLEAFRTTGSFRIGMDVLELMSEMGPVASYRARDDG